MPTEIDTSSIFDTVLPNVYIKRVILTPASTLGTGQGLEYDKGAPDALQTNQYGKKQVNPSNIDFDDLPRGPQGLAVSVEVVIKDKVGKNGKPGWFGTERASKYLNLRVVLSKRKQLTSDLLERNFYPGYLKAAKEQNQFDESVINLGKFLNDDIKLQKQVVLGGEVTYDIAYTATFFVPNANPKNISVFAHTFLDLNKVLQDKFILPSSPKNNYIQGSSIAQHIIRGGETEENAYVYKTPDSKVWAGPVHIKEDGRVMAGASHTAEPHPTLTRNKVSNFIIDDYRVLEDLKKARLLVRPHRMNKRQKGFTKTSEDLTVLKSEAYVTEPEVSSDAKNVLKLVFHIDHERLVRDNTQFGAIFETVDKTARADIIENSPIRDISVYRERVVRGLRKGEARPVEYEDRTELIANSSERKAGRIKRSETKKSLQSSQSKSRKVTVGAIRQINLSANADSGIRSIGVTDYDMSRETDGLYRYYVEMEIEDGTIPFLKRQLQSLSKTRVALGKFIAMASDRRNTLPGTSDFTDSFIKEQSKTSNASSLPWFEAILVYLDVLSNVAKIKYSKLRMAARLLHNLCNPASGNLSGLTTLLSLIEEIESELRRTLGETNPKIDEVDFSARTSGFKGKTTKNTFRVEKKFKRVHDSNIQNDVGYDFLAGTTRKSIGPRQITVEQLQARMESESGKYFSPTSNGSPRQSANGSESTQFQIPNPELASTFYSYLTPAIVYVGDKNTLRTIDKGRDLFASDKYNLMISSIIKSNSLFSSPSSVLNDNVDPTQPEFNIAPVLFLGSGYNDAKTKISQETYTNNLNNLLILDALNLTISSTDTHNTKTTLKDLADGLDVLQAVYEDPESSLGAASNFSTDTLPVEDLLLSEDLKVVGIEEQKDLTGIGNTLINSLVESDDFVFPKKAKKLKKLESLLLASTDNLIDKHFGDRPGSESKKQRFIQNLPIQIKSLLLSIGGDVRKNWLTTKQNTGKDLIDTPDLFGIFYFLYNHINRIEVFVGFQRNKSGDPLVSKPIYERLTPEIISQISQNNQAVLCRMVPYRNNVLGIKKSPKLKLPEFDSVFVIRPSQGGQSEAPAVVQTANDFVRQVSGEESDFSSQVQEAQLNLTGKKLMQEILSLIAHQDNIPPEFSNTATVMQPEGVVKVGTTFSSRRRTPPRPESGISAEQATISRGEVVVPVTTSRAASTASRTVSTTSSPSTGGSY